MSSQYDGDRVPTREEEAQADAKLHFAESLTRLTAYREAVERLERNLSITSLAANIAASSLSSKARIIQTDDGSQWHKDVDLMENIHLCHRSLGGEAEFAAVEHFPANKTNEVWNRGNDAMDVVRAFAQEQRQALQVWTEDIAGQVNEFLAKKYPSLDKDRMTNLFMRRFTQTISPPNIPLHVQNFNQGCSGSNWENSIM